MRSGMAGKHDEMVIYILHSSDLAAAAGANLLSVEKRQGWRQAAQQGWTDLSYKCSDSPVLLHQKFLSWHAAMISTDLKILPSSLQDQFHSESRKWDSTGQQIPGLELLGSGALRSPRTA